ncbi:MAG TPA: hypothetical protein VMT34_10340, partial [Aggregatilineales bacterium]|nr:hypothetical protein [Aggregatilineales bacterium]
WREGDESEMFNFLPLSPALPCIDYTIALKLYGASKPNGVEPRVTPARSNGDDLWVVDHVREYSIGTLTRPMIAATPPPVTPADIPIAGGLYLHSKDLPGQSTLQQGQTLRASLGWSNLGGRDGISVVLQGDNWRDVSNFDWGCAQQPQVISWHQVRVPASATGKAVLKVSDGGDHEVVLAAYDISAVERTYIPPTSIAIPAKAAFSGVGTLIGLDVSKPDGLTLYWQADASAATAYKVFVHLLDSSGTIIAQDDSEPVGGARATTNWLPGEYITDFHKIDGVDWKRVASIRVGLYDPTTETRVLLEDGTDNVTLAVR